MPETFTQDDLDAAVAAAGAELHKRLAELEAQVQETEVGKAISDAVAGKDAEIAELQSKLDSAEAARTAAESKLVETEQFWTDAIAEHEVAAALAARREARVAQAREAGVFGDDYIVSNADRFAAYSDEEWDERLKEWALIATKTGKVSAGSSAGPVNTALVASRSDASSASPSSLSLLTELRANRVDPRALGGTK